MLEIQSDVLGHISLHGKSMIVFPAGSRMASFVNDDYDVILIVAGIDRALDIELNRETVIIIDAGIRTTVNGHGTHAENSKVLFVAGVENVVIGVSNQGSGRVISGRDRDFDIGSIGCFERIEIL